MYQYTATVIRVVDGDTIWLNVDLGFDVQRKDSFRLHGINTPEMGTAEGEASKARLEELVGAPGSRVMIETIKDRREKYGRYLCRILSGNTSANQVLIDEGLAEPYVITSAEWPEGERPT